MASASAMKFITFVTMYSLVANWVSLQEAKNLVERQDARSFYRDYRGLPSLPKRHRRSSPTSDEKQELKPETCSAAGVLSMSTLQKTQTLGLCLRGAKSGYPREKVLLWGTSLALCDTQTDGGGWVVIQRRSQGDVDFGKDWYNYKNGFGTPDTDYWLGLDLIHKLTSQGFTELHIDLMLQGKRYFAHYSKFRVANETLNYKLSVSGYSGTAGDSFTQHQGLGFTTLDRDNDKNPLHNCGMTSGWWFDNCFYSNLNGVWNHQEYMGPHWNSLDRSTSLGSTEMKVRQAAGL